MRLRVRPRKRRLPKRAGLRNKRVQPGSTAVDRSRLEAEAAILQARQSHERLRQAIDILPQGVVFLDQDGRYVLWNKKYAEIYSSSADLFAPGARFEDTLRLGLARGDYPEA